MDPISRGTEALIFPTPQQNPIDQIESPKVLNKTKVIASGLGGTAIGTLNGPLYMNSPPPPPKEVVSDLTSVLHELYKSDDFKEIKRLIDPNRSISISDSFINLAIVREEVQKKAEGESLAGKEVLESPSPEEDFIYLNSHEAILAPKESIKIGNLFDHSDVDQLTPNRLVVAGAAGIGKSTLCQYLANAWAEGSSKLGGWKAKFDFVFLIRFRELAEYPEECLTLEGIVLKSIGKEGTLGEGVLGSKGRKVLFLFDGYDEGAAWIQETPTRRKLWKELLDQPHWILTTRPNYFNEPRRFSDCRKLEIVGFTRKHTAKYIDRFFVDPEEQEKKNSLKKLVQANSRVEALSRIPICLELLCSVWKIKNFDSADSLTMTKLYEEIATYLFQRYDPSLEGMELPLISKDPNRGPLLRATEIVAWMGLVNPKASLIVGPDVFKNPITHLLLSREISDDAKKDFHSKLFRKLGFFKPTSVSENSKRPELASYYFLHLTFQEYFAARHFVERMLTDEPPGDKGNWKDFLQEARFDSKLEVVFWFVVGLLSERARFYESDPSEKAKALKLLNEFFEVLLEEPRSLLRLHELALAMRCFEESEGVSDSLRKRILGEFSSLLRKLSKDTVPAPICENFSSMFPGIQKFYSVDTENEILDAVRAGTVSKALKIISAFRLCTPGIVSFCMEKATDADLHIRHKAKTALGKLHLEAEASRTFKFKQRNLEKACKSFFRTLDDRDESSRDQAAIAISELQKPWQLPKECLEYRANLFLGEAYPSLEFMRSLEKHRLEKEMVSRMFPRFLVPFGCIPQLRFLEGENLNMAVRTLLPMLKSRKNGECELAAEWLGKLSLKGELLDAVLVALSKKLNDPKPDVLVNAACAISRLSPGGEELDRAAEAILDRWLSLDNNSIIEFARASKRKIRGAALQNLAKVLLDPNFHLREEAVEILAELPLEGEALKVLLDPNFHRREEAVEILAKLPLEGEALKGAVSLFLKGIDDPKRRIRIASAKGLGRPQLRGDLLGSVAAALIRILRFEMMIRDDLISISAAFALGRLLLDGEVLTQALDILILSIGDDYYVFRAVSKAIQNLVDLRKVGTSDFSAKVVAYKVVLSQTPCYFRDGSFFFYSQGRVSDPIPMEEARYQEIKKFVKTHLLP